MVEKKEFAITFIKDKLTSGEEIFLPEKVIEGKFDEETECFNDNNDIQYTHIDLLPDHYVGYACRTTLELMKESISEKLLEEIKKEMLDYVNQFNYKRNINGIIIAVNKETGDEYLFEDKDNAEEMPVVDSEEYQMNIDETLGMTPKELEEEIKKTIKGQDEAIRTIVTALWTTLRFRKMKKKNMLIIGPSGVGKTAIFQKIRDILRIPVIIFSVPGLSQAGYVGRNSDEILKQVYMDCGCDETEAERAIVILDEIDKIASRGSTGEISTIGVQNELLKIIEGCERYVDGSSPYEEGFNIDTSKMIFIGTGAFQELFDKQEKNIGFTSTAPKQEKQNIDNKRLMNYGLKRELIGRLPILVELKSLGKKELKEIITESDESELNTNIEALKELGVEVINLDELIDVIAEDALNKQIGARGLVLTINNIFEQIFYKVANNPDKFSKVMIGPNILNDNTDFRLTKRRNYTKKKSI